jgi:hypothetical protein
MGARRPDNVPMVIWRGGCETVGQMIARDWRVMSCCLRCHVKQHTDLKVIAKVRGPNASLWNRRPRCKVIGCGGRVQFHAMPPGCTRFRALDADWPNGGPPGGTG